MANISIKRGSNGSVTITRDSINPYSISGPVNLQQVTGGVSIHPHNTSGLTFEQSKLTILTSDTLTVNDASYTPADAAALHTKLRDEVFFLTSGGNVKLLLSDGLPMAVAHTGTTAETTIYTKELPGNALGPNGILELLTGTTWTNNANSKNYRVKINGQLVLHLTVTTNAAGKYLTTIHNKNSLTENFLIGAATSATNYSLGAHTAANTALTIDTTQPMTLTVTCQLANAADTFSLTMIRVTAYKN